MSDQYDVIVVGSGPGGYVAAIRCSQLGLKTLCIEKHGTENQTSLGGTCLNVGCIPSKSLLDTSHNYFKANNLDAHGITVEKVSFDLPTIQKRKEKVVDSLTAGVKGLFRLNGVSTFRGTASIKNSHSVSVESEGGFVTNFLCDNIMIATGSRPINLPGIEDGKDLIVSSKEALEFKEVPKKLAVVGAGAIGLEMASIWSRLGSKVVILEAVENFLPSVDRQISRQALKVLSQQGLDIRLGVSVESTKLINDQIDVCYKEGSSTHHMTVDKLIVAVGRSPATEGLFVKEFNLEQDEKGFIKVDDSCRTNRDNIYAIGDVVRGPMLAHKASEEGVMVAEIIAGKESEINYSTMPSVIYTHPEIAWAGMTEEQAEAERYEFLSGSFPFSVNGRALASGEIEGMVKVLVDLKDDSILGVHVLGASAADIVQQGVLAMNYNIKAEDIASSVYSHPSLSEAFHEAILSAKGKAIHINNRKRK